MKYIFLSILFFSLLVQNAIAGIHVQGYLENPDPTGDQCVHVVITYDNQNGENYISSGKVTMSQTPQIISDQGALIPLEELIVLPEVHHQLETILSIRGINASALIASDQNAVFCDAYNHYLLISRKLGGADRMEIRHKNGQFIKTFKFNPSLRFETFAVRDLSSGEYQVQLFQGPNLISSQSIALK